MVLHDGHIAEMKTGEGKTLTATLAVVLNSLAVHARPVGPRRRAAPQGRPRGDRQRLPGPPRRRMDEPDLRAPSASPWACSRTCSPTRRSSAAYACDVVYGTNSEFGFDYLRDNMAKDLVRKGPARPPLRDRGRGRQHPDRRGAHAADHLRRARTGRRPVREVRAPGPADESRQDPRRHGPAHEEAVRGGLRLRDRREAQDRLGHRAGRREGRALPRHRPPLPRRERPPRQPPDPVAARRVALQAATSTTPSSTARCKIIDEFTGRILEGRRWSEGLHQAIEAKERVAIQEENQTLATITYQNYFRLYDKLAGMTGTALTEATEFMKIYELPVVQVPTNRPMVRDDRNDQVYKTKDGKWDGGRQRDRRAPRERPAGAGRHDLGRGLRAARRAPDASAGIQHTVLNAKPEHAAREAEIVAEAGQPGRGHDRHQHGRPRRRHQARRQPRAPGRPAAGARRLRVRRPARARAARAGGAARGRSASSSRPASR